jgi:hypothetical protein
MLGSIDSSCGWGSPITAGRRASSAARRRGGHDMSCPYGTCRETKARFAARRGSAATRLLRFIQVSENQDAGLPDPDQRRRGKRQPSGPPVKATGTQKARPTNLGKARRYRGRRGARFIVPLQDQDAGRDAGATEPKHGSEDPPLQNRSMGLKTRHYRIEAWV